MEVFCDHLTVTMPTEHWPAFRSEVTPIFDTAGLSVELSDDSYTLWRQPADHNKVAGGTVSSKQRGAVRVVSATGRVLSLLRTLGLFNEYLSSLGSREHRVTRLDASADLPEDAAPIVHDLAARGHRGELKLTRKTVMARHVTSLMSARWDGVVSGTVYIGSPNADLRLCVYDKTKERDEAGDILATIGMRTRYELRARSGLGVTLRDAADPAPLFFHYLSPGYLPAPESVVPWTPFRDGGFEIDRPAALPPAARLQRRVSTSPEIEALIGLALEERAGGLDYLCHLIRQRAGASAAH